VAINRFIFFPPLEPFDEFGLCVGRRHSTRSQPASAFLVADRATLIAVDNIGQRTLRQSKSARNFPVIRLLQLLLQTTSEMQPAGALTGQAFGAAQPEDDMPVSY
jgi:hypothetical protein